MGRRVGRTGGRLAQSVGSVAVKRIKVIVKPGTNEVVSAYPVE
jgi:hypothetical protein